MAGSKQKPPGQGGTIEPCPGPIRVNILPPDPLPGAPAAAQAPDPLIDTHILQYKIIERLGGGGMGNVYLAEDTPSGKLVALKLMNAQLIIDTEARTRFFREGAILAKLRHPNIVDTLEVGEFHGKPFFVMEYLRGIDLYAHLDTVGSLPLHQQLSILVQLCDALSAIHIHGFIHRDVKLENIVLLQTADGSVRIKLIDFGLAKSNNNQLPDQARLTRPGVCVGSPDYMAPEASTGEENLDHRVDVYSMGVVMYYLLCNKFPYSLVNDPGGLAASLQLAMLHITEDLVPPVEINPSVPQALNDLVIHAMKKDRDDRLSTVAELREGILAYATSVGLTLERVPEDSLHDTDQSPIVIVKHRIPKFLWWAVPLVVVAAVGVSRLIPFAHEEPTQTQAPDLVPPLVDLARYQLTIKTKHPGASVHLLETTADGTRWQKALSETPYAGKLTGKHTIVLTLPGHLPIYLEVDAANNTFTDLDFQRITPSTK